MIPTSLLTLLLSLTCCTINWAAPTTDTLAAEILIVDANGLYIGLQNTIQLVVPGVDPMDVQIKVSGGGSRLHRKSALEYHVRCSQPGEVHFKISDRKTGRTKTFVHQAQRLPDPEVRMWRHSKGLIPVGAMRAQEGLHALLPGVGKRGRCKVASYVLYYQRKGQEPIQYQGYGGRFEGVIKDLVKQAKPGDRFIFTKVRASCPGDVPARYFNGLDYTVR